MPPKKLEVMLIDAFTTTALTGNACLVVLNAHQLSETEMQAIARETNLSETAFVMDSPIADFRARYFTPAEEIPLAGHPTLAVSRALLDSGRLSPTAKSFTLQLEAGVVHVELRETPDGLCFTMQQNKPRFLRTYSPESIMPAFGLSANDVLAHQVIQTVSTGTPMLMIPVKNQASLRRAELNVPLYKALKDSGDFFSPHLFCLQGISADAQTFARQFGVPPDTYEDPFTGSATGSMAAYLWHYGLIDRASFIAEQGHWMSRPGRGYVEIIGSPDAIEAVKVGGHAVSVMRGEFSMESNG